MPEFLFLFIRRLLVSFRKTACDFPGRCRGFSPGNRIFALMKTILCTFFACALFCAVDVRAQQTPLSGAAFIAVCKESMTLAVYDFNSCLRAVYPIACGRALGNKEKPGDMKTPEGLFSVQQIQDASAWTHDFGDGKGGDQRGLRFAFHPSEDARSPRHRYPWNPRSRLDRHACNRRVRPVEQ